MIVERERLEWKTVWLRCYKKYSPREADLGRSRVYVNLFEIIKKTREIMTSKFLTSQASELFPEMCKTNRDTHEIGPCFAPLAGKRMLNVQSYP